MTPSALSPSNRDDANLVQLSLAGDRRAFGRIVARYQALVCGLAYSATGSRSHSEDLAQETFVTAWRKLRDLNDPTRLRAWLCGIARNVIHGNRRRLGRQPAHGADALHEIGEVASSGPLPSAEAISNEEMAILWREVGRLPEVYREPLILYYRDQQSVDRVAEALELTPDAVMQRLTRGRRMLRDRMLEFVETTLRRTNPGPQFTLQVEAALPLLAGGPMVAATTAANSGAAAKGGVMGFILAWVAPVVGLVAAAGVSWSEIAQAPTSRERRYVARWMLALWLSAAALVAGLWTVPRWVAALGFQRQPAGWRTTAPEVALWFLYTLVAMTMIVLMIRGRAALRRELGGAASPAAVPSGARALATLAGVLIATFWVLLFVAWQTGDRAVAAGIAGAVLALAIAGIVLGRHAQRTRAEPRWSGWYLAACGLVFLAILNGRLDVWLAKAYGVDVATMHHLLPMGVIHTLSLIVVVWTAALVFLTRPKAGR